MLKLGTVKFRIFCQECEGDLVWDSLEIDGTNLQYKLGVYCPTCDASGVKKLEPLDQFIEIEATMLGLLGISHHDYSDDDTEGGNEDGEEKEPPKQIPPPK